MTITIRKAEPKDCATILTLIKELAVYEKMLDEVVATEELIHQALFGDAPYAHTLLAFDGEQPVGMALYFFNFSTFLGRPGLYLEDLYVKLEARGQGIGKRLLQELAKLAKAKNCGRMEWCVLNWNESAIGFYKKLGAELMNEWTTCRVSGEALSKLTE